MKKDRDRGEPGDAPAPAQRDRKQKRGKSGRPSFNHWLFQTMAYGQRAEKGEVRYLVLDALADRARHGYDIIRSIASRSEQVYSPSTGVVYPTLHVLEDGELVRSYEADGLKLFEITDAGRQELEDNREVIEDIYDRLCGHVPTLQGESFQALGRQVDRIFKSLKKSFQSGQLGADKVDAICGVLEEASERIDKILNKKRR